MADHNEVASYFSGNSISRDMLALICGDEPLGSGIARTVYPCLLNEDYVIKVETSARSFQNVWEWGNWEDMEHAPKWSRWLAPCISISPCGTVLVQRRTTPAPPEIIKATTKLPKFLTDTKPENYGMLEGRLVCHDYGFVRADFPRKLKKVEW